MQWVSSRDTSDVRRFGSAVLQGAASGGGLYVPVAIPTQQVDPAQSFAARAAAMLRPWVGDVGDLDALCAEAFDFPVPLVRLSPTRAVLELFHGPTLAFKDFGARFLARVLAHERQDRRITVLTATSGDTGAAVAHAFYGVPGIDVHVLYPEGRISDLQERLFCGLGGNVRTWAVQGAFDDCQAMVKACFRDADLTAELGLTSANSINAARLVAQMTYYAEAVAQQPEAVVVVPSGNFGNLTAGLYARAAGLPVAGFVAATNRNDVVPAFLDGGPYAPRSSVATPSNAMDVGAPSNWERIRALYPDDAAARAALSGGRASDQQTFTAMRRWWAEAGVAIDPHTAVGLHVADEVIGDRPVIVLGTAHPAKFKSTVDEVLEIDLPLPPALAAVADGPVLSGRLAPTADALTEALRA